MKFFNIFTLIFSFLVGAAIHAGDLPEQIEINPEVGSEKRLAIVLLPSVFKKTHVGDGTVVQIEFMAGPLSQFRLEIQPHLFQSIRASLEVMYGGGFTPIGTLQYLGGGARAEFSVLSDQKHHALVFAPGVDAFVGWDDVPGHGGWFNNGVYGKVYFVGADVDVAWNYQPYEHFGTKLGVEVGGAVVVNGKNDQDQESSGKVIPRFGVVAGLRF